MLLWFEMRVTLQVVDLEGILSTPCPALPDIADHLLGDAKLPSDSCRRHSPLENGMPLHRSRRLDHVDLPRLLRGESCSGFPDSACLGGGHCDDAGIFLFTWEPNDYKY
mmetsp:Transcript_55328/g.145927  ORF Transcript_55328/g.145927 Transcript_55328/m.145927 type:complete len:109 (+) Transcript_55328:278-604(+)